MAALRATMASSGSALSDLSVEDVFLGVVFMPSR